MEKHSQKPVTYLAVGRCISSSRCNTHLYNCRMTVDQVSAQAAAHPQRFIKYTFMPVCCASSTDLLSKNTINSTL